MQSNMTDLPTGVIVPVFTPLTESGNVDEAAFRRLIKRCLAAGVDSIFVGGSAGMGPMLTDAQWECAVATAVEEVGTKARLLVGIISTSTQLAVERIGVSRRLGSRHIVVTPTFYISLSRDAELLSHFEACRDATDQEMIIYNIPSCIHSVISPAVFRTAVERGWTHAIKESSGDRGYFSQILSIGKELGVSVLQGNEPDIAWGLRAGASGIVPVCANCEPETFVRSYQAAKRGDFHAADVIQKRIDHVRDVLLIGDHNWISGLSCGLAALGIGQGRPLLPLQPVGAERKALIYDLLAAGVPA